MPLGPSLYIAINFFNKTEVQSLKGQNSVVLYNATL